MSLALTLLWGETYSWSVRHRDDVMPRYQYHRFITVRLRDKVSRVNDEVLRMKDESLRRPQKIHLDGLDA
jgi:hypothetical protein